MKYITIGFSKPKKPNIISNLIMKIEKVNYSHVYLSFRSIKLNRTLIYQANRRGIWFIGREKFASHNKVVDFFLVGLSEEQYNNTLRVCVDLSGSEYSFVGLVWNGLKEIFGIKRNIEDKNKYICSKLVGYILECCGIDVPQDLNEVTPRNLYDLLFTYNGSVKVLYGKDQSPTE